ncbi:FCH-domain-containing protein [Cucurbitaria berberidis CBS 394.84]|uniref:Protein BZZ1 n=1 Tax=Cucurbitaria berberidis CBS 394.84 TaxID=1168544 RepID=A0A9P4GQG5_9PLEO|nr:FCH-domain-containing protein [Cucurbitaria berberidis CBS 394.84]KAF1849400.1 FCH-domain-containing protein [Cucurbitaria berberidis CBS 394.84]
MEVDIAPQFGAELKDGYKTVNAWVTGGISWLDDIQQFYRERSAIEKEYSAKLSALAKKYYEKKARKVSSISVGDTPTVTPGSLESASMTTWGVQLSTLESRASEHDQFAGALINKLADPLKHLGTRYEELRKLHGDFAAKLEKERDSQYAELRKQKGKYDSVCQEVESRRKKVDGAFDHGKGKARNAFEQQQVEMRNVKNTYIISINVTNKQKEMYYHEYVPELLDSLQDLSETRVNKLNSIWSLAAQIETDTLTRSTDYMKHLSAEIPRNNPLLDSMMFVRHNAGSWQEPGDFQFEPSPVWLDDSSIAVDDSATVFLRNVLTKTKASLGDYRRELEKKRKEVENAKTVRRNIREGKDKRDEVDVVRAVFAIQEAMHEVERQKVSAEVEVSTITSVVGDLSIGARNHNFKSQTFKIPTNCDLCGDRIWGLSAKGFDCRDCGYTCHSKCEMKVPANCPGEQSKEEKKKLKEERQKATHAVTATNGTATGSNADMPRLGRSDTVNSMNTLSSGYSATAHRSISGGMSPTAEEPAPVEKKAAPAPGPRRNRMIAPPPAHYVKDGDDVPPPTPKGNEVKGRMLYAYQENSEGELTVADGQEVTILEPDGRSFANLSPMFQILLGAVLTNDYTDGSGWIKVRVGSKEGLVPASYVEILAPTPPTTASTFSSNRPDSTYSASSASTTNLSAAIVGKKKGPAVAPKRGAKKLKYVEALYDYAATSEAEHSMAEGERFVLINMDAGDGWADVERDGVVRSVPANYVQQV